MGDINCNDVTLLSSLALLAAKLRAEVDAMQTTLARQVHSIEPTLAGSSQQKELQVPGAWVQWWQQIESSVVTWLHNLLDSASQSQMRWHSSSCVLKIFSELVRLRQIQVSHSLL